MTNDTTTGTGTLSDAQKEQFMTQGYLLLRGAFSGDDSTAWVREECARAGYDLDDSTTWKSPYLRLPTVRRERLDTYAPSAWEASCALLGGGERVKGRPGINLMAVNLAQGAERPFAEPSPNSPGWHKDGWHFRHFLDTADQGLLGLPLLTDVLPHGGATFIAVGSIGPVARFLAEHPEGVGPDDFPVQDLVSGCEFIEATGSAGDVYLCHPYLLHATSQNVLRRPRAISNIAYELNEPMQFDRADGNYSPVEAAILAGLGVDRYSFSITGERYRTPDDGPMNPKWR